MLPMYCCHPRLRLCLRYTTFGPSTPTAAQHSVHKYHPEHMSGQKESREYKTTIISTRKSHFDLHVFSDPCNGRRAGKLGSADRRLTRALNFTSSAILPFACTLLSLLHFPRQCSPTATLYAVRRMVMIYTFTHKPSSAHFNNGALSTNPKT
jgi:hypothetical protein